METANRDEALRCLGKAQTALREGRVEAAEKFASKSLRLCPTEEAKEFQNKLKSAGPPPSPRPAPRKEQVKKEEVKETTTHEREYTPEQKTAVRRVLDLHDYYEILDIPKSASETDIKKQYKRLALQLHPDKNSAPKSDEAFKSVSKAYAVLSDPEKRNHYDRFGEDGLRATNSFAEPEVNPDEIFRMFFGDAFFGTGGFGPRRRNVYYQDSYGRVYRRNPHMRGGSGVHPREAQSTMAMICQLVPVILLLSVALFGNLLTGLLPPAPFSLHKTNMYPVQRITQEHSIPYFVQHSFKREFANKNNLLVSVERDVINEYMWDLSLQCNSDRHTSRRRGRGNKKPKSCVKLEELKSKMHVRTAV